MKKVSKDDLVIDVLNFSIKYSPYIRANQHSKEFDEELLLYLDVIINKNSNIMGINSRKQYDIIFSIAIHVIEGLLGVDEKVLKDLEVIINNLLNNKYPNKNPISIYGKARLSYLLIRLEGQRLKSHSARM